MRTFQRQANIAEAVAWVTGILLLTATATAYVDSALASRRAIHHFAALQRTATSANLATPDLTLWSPDRIAAWRSALKVSGSTPLGVMRIARLGLEVPIFPGTDEVTLNRGAGHIEDTAAPGTPGNAGIAGHRDGFFRTLKDVVTGDVIELETLHGREIYRIERTWIVRPEEVSVLDPTPDRSLTLVTCYPFYFVGSAPQRFIVRAVLTGSVATAAPARPGDRDRSP